MSTHLQNPVHILVAGAGIGGLCAAIILAKNGARVEMFEQAPQCGSAGAGIQQSPNAMHVHAAMGTADALKAVAFEPQSAVFRHHTTGRAEMVTRMTDIYLQRYGQKYLHVHRADLHRVLWDAAKNAGVTFHLGTSVTHYTQTEDQVRLVTNKGEYTGEVLIGGDGIHSKTRETMLGASPARFTGQVAWRGLIQADKIPVGTIAPVVNNWLGPDRHFISYYVRGGKMINFVAVEARQDWTEESWNIAGNIADVQAAFRGWDPVIHTLLTACDTCYLWGLFDRPVLAQWVDGRTALIGDAAHPMLPFMAQGAAMAIEDGWVLAQKILTSPTDISSALTAYEHARKARATFVQSMSRDNADLFHVNSPHGRWVRRQKFKIGTRFPSLILSRLDKVFGVDVTQDHPL